MERLPKTLPTEGSVRVELAQGVLVFRASRFFLERIEMLKAQKNVTELSSEELQEFQDYEELNNYLAWVNRTADNNPRLTQILAYLDIQTLK